MLSPSTITMRSYFEGRCARHEDLIYAENVLKELVSVSAVHVHVGRGLQLLFFAWYGVAVPVIASVSNVLHFFLADVQQYADGSYLIRSLIMVTETKKIQH